MPTISEFLLERLDPLVDAVFGIPGDYILRFYDQLDKKFDVITTTDEQCAGFAADAYARVHGFGVVCVTYCVGGLKILNPIAAAYAEKSPMLVISGAPGVKERQSGLLLHHAAGPYECQREIFKNLTCATAILDDPTWAGHEIDRVIDAIQYHKQPGYLEIPRDMVDKNVKYDVYMQGTPNSTPIDQENLDEALEKSIEWLERSESPVILAGVELARFGFGEEIIKFADRNNIPVATTILGKSVVSEYHPLCLGIYAGAMSHDRIRQIVENSDCVLQLGVMQTDMNMAFQPFQCNQTRVIQANTGRVRVRRSTYENVSFQEFVNKLLQVKLSNGKQASRVQVRKTVFTPEKGRKLTTERLFEKIDAIIEKDNAIIADVGDSLFGAADLRVHHCNQFLAPAFYTSMGNSVPGALGVQTARPDLRPIVIVGDGAFQMTGMEFSTIVRRGLNPVILVLNNDGYATERMLGCDGQYNDVQNWDYENIPKVVGGGVGYTASTEDELDRALDAALKDTKSASIINVIVDKMDVTPALKRMTDNLSKRI